ncbi:MAG TPA: TIGR02206 family membrane protein [Candidatus Marinimicrobia bacterium]|nr:TIGR02206 family membrane protein [Candidatus Neomarinimicrobiota bacterium]
MTSPHEILEPLSAIWWQTIVWLTVIIGGILFVAKKLNKDQLELLAKMIGVILIARSILVNPYVANLKGWDIYNNLPLHLCGLSAIISGIIMFYRKQWMYECLYYWGIPGAFHAFLTPEFTQGTEGLLFLEYYIAHGGIILSALFCTLYLGFSPRKGSWWRIFLWSQLLLPIVGGFNWLIDANYMFICAPPIVDNPFVIGDFPEHLIGLEIAGLLHFAIVYLPFGLKYRRISKTSGTPAI